MADAAEFVIRLVDRATAPARRISSAMKGVNKSLKPITGSKAFQAIDKVGDKLFNFGKTAALVGGAVGVGLAAAFTKASVDAAMFGENTTLAFERLTGSSSEGARAFATVKGLVADLGLDLHDTTDGMRKLLAAQFSLGESTELLKMSSDLSAIGIHGEEAKRVLMAITQIKAKGKVQQEELLQLAEAGVSLSLVQGELQKALGKSRDEVAKLQQAGKIGSEVGLEAIRSAVRQKLHITEFGEARKAFIDSNLSGMIEQLKSAGQLFLFKLGDSVKEAAFAMKPLVKETTEWVRTLDTSSVTEVVKSVLATLKAALPLAREFFTGFLEGFGSLSDNLRLDINSASLQDAADAGRAVAEAIGTIISAARMAASALTFFTTPVGKVVGWFALLVIGAVKVIGVVTTIAGAIGPLATAFSAVGSAIGVAAGWIVTFAEAIAFIGFGAVGAFTAALAAVAGSAFLVYDQLRKLFDVASFSEIFELMKADFFGFGWGVVKGMAEGIVNATHFVIEAVKNLGTTAIDAVAGVLGIASPSKEFEKLGMFSGEGFQRGLDTSAPSIESASARAIAAPSLQGAEGVAFGGGGSQISVPVNVSVEGSGDPRETAEMIADILPGRIADVLESLISPSPVPT